MSDPSPLEMATFDEIVEELRRRSSAVVVGITIQDTDDAGVECATTKIRYLGDRMGCLGISSTLHHFVKKDAMKEFSDAMAQDDDDEETE